MIMTTILYTLFGSFPLGSASSARAKNLVDLALLNGFNVIVVADFKNGDCSKYNCFFASEKALSIEESIKNQKNLIVGLLKNHDIDLIITNAYYSKVLNLLKIRKNYCFKLIVENCEWYDKTNYKLHCLNLRFIQNEIMMRFLFKKVDGFISISRLLNNHNLAFGKPSVRIPTILDVSSTEFDYHRVEGKLNLVYAGNPGISKELLYPIIEAIHQEKSLSNIIIFHIYGPSYNQCLSNKGMTKELLDLDFVKIHGHIEQDNIGSVFKQADYLIFIRPNRKSSNSGFPTKLAESMACGTPAITNRTGDIPMYVDGNNGVLLDDNSVSAVRKALLKACYNNENYCDMRNNARQTSMMYFDYKSYKKDFYNFIEMVLGGD